MFWRVFLFMQSYGKYNRKINGRENAGLLGIDRPERTGCGDFREK